MKIPVKFKRVAAAFDEVAAAARGRSCESSGSEHSADLSDLVNSFLEGEIREQIKNREVVDRDKEIGSEVNDDDEDNQLEGNSKDFETRDALKKLFELENDAVKGSIHGEVEAACRDFGGGGVSSSPDFKRRIMARLRSRGFDAGLCKSRWDKSGTSPPGNHEYVDVNAGGHRYIIELSLAGEFTIARPTDGYASLLEVFPQISVIKQDDLKQVVRVMCKAIRRSMKRVDIHVPPWRRRTYIQSKWFAAYKRTTKETSSRKVPNLDGDMSPNQRVGFAPVQGISISCREDFAAGAGFRIGNLTAAMNQNEMLL